MQNIRNIAIIAHVDHGKTTLVDALLRQTQTKLSREMEGVDLIMDSNDLERERGITIFSKNASVVYKDVKVNIVDTPGHADFGGEVERVLKLVDGCLLLVDSKEGPMPQTRFVLKQALKMGLKVIVVVNKIDRSDARIDEVINKTFDLFLELGADEDSAYFPVVYASGKLGKAGESANLSEMSDISPIFESILKYIPSPKGEIEAPLQMMVTSTLMDNFKGRIATGRIVCGKIRQGQEIIHINRLGEKSKHRLTSVMTFEGLERVIAEQAFAGDIVAISGVPEIMIGETITDNLDSARLPLIAIEEPTVNVTIGVNTSPVSGREGEFKTSRQIEERLMKAQENDVALRVEQLGGGCKVSGRGELHLAILIEGMRREGYEFQVSRPKVIEKRVDGKLFTPMERVYIEVPENFSGVVIQKMGERHGELVDMRSEGGSVVLVYIIATKELFGFRSKFITDTKGQGVMSSEFYDYKEDAGNVYARENGSLVAYETGVTKLYALISAQERGTLFLGANMPVYKGQVIGQNSRVEDIKVNVCREKHLTNHRSKGEGVSGHFDTPREMGLEEALEYIDDSELVEVTPKNIRIRKLDLNG